MEKEWFIHIEGKQEGPFSIKDLKNDHRLTPDTLVWKKGMKKWMPIRSIPELKEIFEDEVKPQIEEFKKKPLPSNGKDEVVLDMRGDLPPILIWILALLLLILLYRVIK